MELIEIERSQKYPKQCRHCTPNTILPFANQWTCTRSGYNVIKRKKRTYRNTTKEFKFLQQTEVR